MNPTVIGYASSKEAKAPFRRRVAAAAIDVLLLAILQVPLHILEYISAWGNRRYYPAIWLALGVLIAFSAADGVGFSVGKRLMGVVVRPSDVLRLTCRWFWKWWWVLASPVLFDRMRPSGSAFWALGVPPPTWTEVLPSISVWFVGLWLTADLLFALGPRHRFLHDQLSKTDLMLNSSVGS